MGRKDDAINAMRKCTTGFFDDLHQNTFVVFLTSIPVQIWAIDKRKASQSLFQRDRIQCQEKTRRSFLSRRFPTFPPALAARQDREKGRLPSPPYPYWVSPSPSGVFFRSLTSGLIQAEVASWQPLAIGNISRLMVYLYRKLKLWVANDL